MTKSGENVAEDTFVHKDIDVPTTSNNKATSAPDADGSILSKELPAGVVEDSTANKPEEATEKTTDATITATVPPKPPAAKETDPSATTVANGTPEEASKTIPSAPATTSAATIASATSTAPASDSQGSLTFVKPVSVTTATNTYTTTASTVSVTEEKPPLKSTRMSHLRQKYSVELEYMLREFEKLERQLLGARKTEESAASRERREKLHSFILHLTETIQQIEKGCELEAAGLSTLPATQPKGAGKDGALVKPSADKEEEENAQKLEEHILANLLPVKVRLKKQLAAQQGAKHNPATMPHRGGHAVATPAVAGSTFADSARRQQEAAKAQQEENIVPAQPVAPDETQFGKPLVKGSCLTKKLHGPTLGSSERAHGDGVGASSETNHDPKKKYVGGLAVGSAQMESSFEAASNVHKLVIQEPALVQQNQGATEDATRSVDNEVAVQKASAAHVVDDTVHKSVTVIQHPSDVSGRTGMTEERRRKLRRKKKKKMRLKEQAKAAAAEKREMEKGRKQKTAKKSHRGPRHVEYMCALCNEVYNSTCDYNPWWALSQHDCPKCRKRQVSFRIRFCDLVLFRKSHSLGVDSAD